MIRYRLSVAVIKHLLSRILPYVLKALAVYIILYPPAIKAQDRCAPLVLSEHYAKHGTLDYLEHALSPQAQADDAPIVIGLHGLGHHKEGFSGLAKQLPNSWRVIFINAPFQYSRGRAWYRYRCPQAEQDLKLSIKAVFKTLESIKKRYPKSPQPALFGFSQGGVMSMALLNKQPQYWSAVVNFSGYWLSKTAPVKHSLKSLPPLLIVHGERDRVVPFDRGLNAAQIMEEAGYLISWLPFNGGHHVPQVGLKSLVTHVNNAWALLKTKAGGLGQKQGKE